MQKFSKPAAAFDNDDGFSIIEVLVAISIFSIAFMGLTLAVIDAGRTARATTIADQSVMVGQESIEMLSCLPINNDALDGTKYEVEKNQATLDLEWQALNPVDSDGDGTPDYVTISVWVSSVQIGKDPELKMQTYYRRQIN